MELTKSDEINEIKFLNIVLSEQLIAVNLIPDLAAPNFNGLRYVARFVRFAGHNY